MKKSLILILVLFSACKSIEDSSSNLKTNISGDLNSIQNHLLYNKPIILKKFKKSVDNISYFFYFKSKIVCFKFEYISQDLTLNLVDFCNNSFQKTIFNSNQQDTLNFKFSQTPRMEVFSSIDKRNTYMCLFDESRLLIWSLVNGNTVQFLEVKPNEK
jgi:DNA polymerase III sliding clamp (beta) subunit (PCNA family)